MKTSTTSTSKWHLEYRDDWQTCSLADCQFAAGQSEADFVCIGFTNFDGQGLRVLKHRDGPLCHMPDGDAVQTIQRLTATFPDTFVPLQRLWQLMLAEYAVHNDDDFRAWLASKELEQGEINQITEAILEFLNPNEP